MKQLKNHLNFFIKNNWLNDVEEKRHTTHEFLLRSYPYFLANFRIKSTNASTPSSGIEL